MTSLETCPTCTEITKLLCSGCRAVNYCSEECQEADWPAHKLLCSAYKDMEARPNENARRVLFFPPDSSKPVFLWRKVLTYHDDDGTLSFKKPRLSEEMGTEHPDVSTIDRNAITGVPLGYHIYLRYDDNFLQNYQKENLAVAAATKGFSRISWRGPILAYCGLVDPVSAKQDIVNVTDMCMMEYSHVIAYFIRTYRSTDADAALKGPKIEAVKVMCNGAIDAGKGPRFQAVKYPRSHPQMRALGTVSPISKVCRCSKGVS